jgi:hypothetical protein
MSVRTTDSLPESKPMTVSPSQCPSSTRLAAISGRSSILLPRKRLFGGSYPCVSFVSGLRQLKERQGQRPAHSSL